MQASQFKTIAKRHHVGKIHIAMAVIEIGERSLQLAHKILKDRLYRGDHLLEIRTIFRLHLGNRLFQVLRLGKSQFKFLGDFLGEPAATDTDGSLFYHTRSIGQNQVADIGADIQRKHPGFGWFIILAGIHITAIRLVIVTQNIIGNIIDQRKRSHLHRLQVDVHIAIMLKSLGNEIPLHGKEADFCIQRQTIDHHSGAKFLKIPNHLIQWKWNLLFGFKPDDIADLVLLHGG